MSKEQELHTYMENAGKNISINCIGNMYFIVCVTLNEKLYHALYIDTITPRVHRFGIIHNPKMQYISKTLVHSVEKFFSLI